MTDLPFINLEAFYAERRLNRDPGGGWWADEYDYGLYWYDAHRNTYRLSWMGPIGRTDESAPPGELYIAKLNDGVVQWLCTIPPVPHGLDEALRDVSPVRADYNVEQILTGWADVCGEPNSLGWIRDRVWEALRAGWATKPGLRAVSS
jgi:hypothetical protein